MSLSDCQYLNFERRDQGVLLITLNRPESCNATGEQMHGKLARVGADVPRPPATVPDGGPELPTSRGPR